MNYTYDAANRLTQAGGLAYTWDDNGNLLSDGTNTYAFDHANRLAGIAGQVSYAYNGLGDRLQETTNGATTNFTMDLAKGLTQVLADGTHTYLYGAGRIAQGGNEGMQYFVGDALGSVRQLVDSNAGVVLAQAYEPYGQKLKTAGMASSAYGYTGEWQDASRVYLRARFYEPGTGRFMSRDTWGGAAKRPMSLNRWNYTESNPINFVDPSGRCRDDDRACIAKLKEIEQFYYVTVDRGSNTKISWFNDCGSQNFSGYQDIRAMGTYWSKTELDDVEKALRLMKKFLDSTRTPFGNNIGKGSTAFRKVVYNSQGGTNVLTVGEHYFDFQFQALWSRVEVTAELFSNDNRHQRIGILMHELFHVYDYSNAIRYYYLTAFDHDILSNEDPVWKETLKGTTPGSQCGPTRYACDNSADNFADSATIYALSWLVNKNQDVDAMAVQKAYPDAATGKLDVEIDPSQWMDKGIRVERFRALFGVDYK